MGLVIVGSIAFDTIETPEERREKIVGGSCTYCSLAASFFTRPAIVAVVGRDFPQETIDFFRKRSIDIRGLEIKPGKTFHWEGRYEKDLNMRSTIKTELNVFKDFHPSLPKAFRSAGIVFFANIDPEVQVKILSQTHATRLVAMDTIYYWIQNKKEALFEALKKVDVFFANDEEVRMLSGEHNLIKAGKKILGMGPFLAVVKKGEHGALVFRKDFVFGVLAHPCEEVTDPTGAGDSFAGGFLGYIDRSGAFHKKEICKAAVYGSVMASFAIEDFGIDRFRSLGNEEIEQRYKQFKKLVSF